jgi:adenylate cyclase
MERGGHLTAAQSGAELQERVRRGLLRSAVIANGLGGAVVFVFGVLAPGSPDPGSNFRLGVMNGITFVVFSACAFMIGPRVAQRVGAPLERWLRSGRPATVQEGDLALRFPGRMTMISVKLWAGAAVVFTLVNSTYSPEQGASSAVITLLGGTTCCALLYLLVEQVTRPMVARALAGAAPPKLRGPTVATRLTMAWTLVTGVPLVGSRRS